MICGNEESIILKCLESAKEAFDEFCLVRAIGNQPADATMGLAQDWCEKNGKSFHCAEYKNQVDFPHVDNFGAARQKSLELTTGDWWLWLDCDDYLDPINCQRIREAVKTEDHDALYCTYKIEAQGGEILRERLIRKGFGRWKNAIHETCVVNGRIANCPQIVVYHSDHKAKHTTSAGRNATILSGVLEDAPRHYFYYQAELKALGRKEEALAAGKIALQLLKPSQVEELYVVRLNLSELEPDKTRDHLLEAVKLQPHRREAFAYLCQKSIIDGMASDAVSYFRVMDALPLPSPLPWTHQGLWYGWARNLLRVRILRLCGQIDQADKEHAEHMKDPDYAEGVEKD